MRIGKCIRVFTVMILLGVVWLGTARAETAALEKKSGFDMKKVERGRYMVTIGACNDCHTPGYLENNGEAPLSKWLIGNTLGWRGPWGTTYPRNLRLFISTLTEDQWVSTAKTLRRRPPMPWFNLNAMEDGDLRAVYQFIRYLGPAGEQAPAALPPGEEPKGPYVTWPAPPTK